MWTHVTAILTTNCHQATELHRLARVPRAKAFVMPCPVDCRYFSGISPVPGAGGGYLVAVGLDGRDYPTLVDAVRGLDVELIIAAHSLWLDGARPVLPDLPANVTVTPRVITDGELRELYSGAALAVVPVQESPYDHGVTALREAMAMGLPVIVTRSTGLGDLVIDRRRVLRTDPGLQTKGGFARLLEPGRPELQDSNGFYVGVGDVEGMRSAICYLLREREVAVSLGATAQRFAREILSLDSYTRRAQRLVSAAWNGQPVSQATLMLDAPPAGAVQAVASAEP